MTNHRIITTLAVAAASLATAAPASYGGPSLSAAIQLEAHAGASTAAAQKVMRTSSARARRLVARGTRQLSRAAAIVRQADAKASASASSADNEAVLRAQASLSSAAAGQSATLSSIARTASGRLVAVARRARDRADAIQAQADDALSGANDGPGVVSVGVSAQAGADGGDQQSAGGIQLLGIFSGDAGR